VATLSSFAPKSKANIRSLFHLIYVHARRWELTDSNPIDLVRQSAGRKTIPRTLSTREIGLLLAQLAEPSHDGSGCLSWAAR
jgi:site-specific recombinase XerD